MVLRLVIWQPLCGGSIDEWCMEPATAMKHWHIQGHIDTCSSFRKWHNWVQSHVLVSDTDTCWTTDTPLIRSSRQQV